jgi:hypothetical protein
MIRRSGAARLLLEGQAGVNNTAARYSNDVTGPNYALNKYRGTIAMPAAVAQNDQLGTCFWQGYDGSGIRIAAHFRAIVIAPSPSSADMETRLVFSACAAGSGTASELFRFDHATGLSLYGANPVINHNRHFRKRQYAAGALPAQNAGDEIASSDITAAPLVSDGVEWLSPGIKRLRAVTADTAVSIPPGWAIDQIFYCEAAGNAVTGGIRIGTTSGAADVVAVQAVSANALGEIAAASILKKVFSRAAAQTLHIQAVTAWNAASLELSFVLRKVF